MHRKTDAFCGWCSCRLVSCALSAGRSFGLCFGRPKYGVIAVLISCRDFNLAVWIRVAKNHCYSCGSHKCLAIDKEEHEQRRGPWSLGAVVWFDFVQCRCPYRKAKRSKTSKLRWLSHLSVNFSLESNFKQAVGQDVLLWLEFLCNWLMYRVYHTWPTLLTRDCCLYL